MSIQHYYILFQFTILMLFSTSLSGQVSEKKIINQSLSLFIYNNSLEISPKWSVNSDVQERSFIKPVRQSQFFLRSQINYSLGQNWIATAGMAYYLSSPGDPSASSSLVVGELRLNQDLNYKQKFRAFSIGHRYRIEERFIGKSLNDSLISGYNFIERLSYTVSFEYNLFKSANNFHTLSFKASDGIFINANKYIVYNTFDQNRFYAALNYQILKNIYVELGYLNLFQQQSSGDHFYNRDIASLSINHKMKMKQPVTVRQKISGKFPPLDDRIVNDKHKETE